MLGDLSEVRCPRLAAAGHWVPTHLFPRSFNLLYTAFFKAWGWRPAVQQIDSRFDGFRFLAWLLLRGSYETLARLALAANRLEGHVGIYIPVPPAQV